MMTDDSSRELSGAVKQTPAPVVGAGVRLALEAVLAYEQEKAKLNGFSDCTCMGHSREAEAAYEAGQCPHQKARRAIADTVIETGGRGE